MMSSLYDKAWIPTRAIYDVWIRKTSSYMLLILHWVQLSFVDPYERFAMLLKSRSRTHHPNMHYSYAEVGVDICLPSRSTQKCSTPTLGASTKNMLVRFSIHQINALSSCCYLSKFCCRKETWGYAKVIHKKRKKKWWWGKNGHKSVRYIENNGYSDARLKKEEINKIAPTL